MIYALFGCWTGWYPGVDSMELNKQDVDGRQISLFRNVALQNKLGKLSEVVMIS